MQHAASQRQKDEHRIVALLDAVQALPAGQSAQRKVIEDQILVLVDRHFREFLKPLLLVEFGRAAGEGGVARYTVMMNDFFIKVLQKRPDPFWHAKSAETLRKWVSVVVSNQMRDFLRRERRYEHGFDAIAPLVAERRDFFEAKTGKSFTIRAIDLIDAWCGSEDDGKRLQGWVLRHRFIDGMTRDRIGDQLNISVHTVRKVLAAGIAALRAALTD